ncbi:hypothetical protein PGTUg99_035635 [Puccinia graminis f. sp. tritici]|uniref:Uncharacterized protein n=1 Tax=Puccinia graminis f. sp. tritici TaxID=56615 RepID=A0A5B0MIP0_PUCGR|nr:hypothetical protein PGTUg99_035635 [Puccinia graminis f. sp. tritici]
MDRTFDPLTCLCFRYASRLATEFAEIQKWSDRSSFIVRLATDAEQESLPREAGFHGVSQTVPFMAGNPYCNDIIIASCHVTSFGIYPRRYTYALYLIYRPPMHDMDSPATPESTAPEAGVGWRMDALVWNHQFPRCSRRQSRKQSEGFRRRHLSQRRSNLTGAKTVLQNSPERNRLEFRGCADSHWAWVIEREAPLLIPSNLSL